MMMQLKNVVGSLAWSLLAAVAGALSASEPGSAILDTFSMDGQAIITDPGHLGVINGKLTIGTPQAQIARIDGLWAPPYVSSDFSLSVDIFGQEVPVRSFAWWPFKVEQRGEVHGIEVTASIVLAAGRRGGLVVVQLMNATQRRVEVPLAFKSRGTLDDCNFWEFSGARSATATQPAAQQAWLTLHADPLAIVLQGVQGTLRWDAASQVGKQTVKLDPGERGTIFMAFAIGALPEAQADCRAMAADLEQTLREADASHGKRVDGIFQKLPRFVASNKDLQEIYSRSLVHFITNRWDVPEFVLKPYYSTGSIRGGCVCNYLWNYGEIWEIMPLYDPAAHREHIKQFLKCDMTQHFSFNPIDGEAFGPWYMVNQEKIIGLIYYYVKTSGDTAFLHEVVGGKTVLEHALENAKVLDDFSKPVELIDYGPSNSHLELRRNYTYNHIMPDLNGRRHANYLRAARLAEIAGKPAPDLIERADALKRRIKEKLWNPRTAWFDFINGEGQPETRYTVQMFKLFGSSVLDAEQEAGLMSHLNEKEFLSEHGLHSLAKGDPAYDPADVDNGGPGACTCFPPQIVERLYKAGEPRQAEDILRRCLWWGRTMPYWGDSIVTERIDYRRDTPLQCTIDGVTWAQCIIFGMFGIDARFDGRIFVSPRPPAYSPQISLREIKLRDIVFDVDVDGSRYQVTSGGEVLTASVGQTVSIKENGSLELVEDHQGAGEY
ncbi:MAG: hypothetical protein JW829_19210 [Pirellulales bacterium]|nr:hypothetical protein [Pirellulales bacterium]